MEWIYLLAGDLELFRAHAMGFPERVPRALPEQGLQPESMTTCYAMAENVFAVTQGGIDGPVGF